MIEGVPRMFVKIVNYVQVVLFLYTVCLVKSGLCRNKIFVKEKLGDLSQLCCDFIIILYICYIKYEQIGLRSSCC